MLSINSSNRSNDHMLQQIYGLALAMQILEMLAAKDDDEEDRKENALAIALLSGMLAGTERSSMFYSSRTVTETYAPEKPSSSVSFDA